MSHEAPVQVRLALEALLEGCADRMLELYGDNHIESFVLSWEIKTKDGGFSKGSSFNTNMPKKDHFNAG